MSPRPRNSSPATSFNGSSAGTSLMNRLTAVSISDLVSDGEDRRASLDDHTTLTLALALWPALPITLITYEPWAR
jgi:hypothetical protein